MKPVRHLDKEQQDRDNLLIVEQLNVKKLKSFL